MKGLFSGALVAVALTLAGCDRVDPDSPLGQRKAIFQEMLEVKEDMGGMLRGRLAFSAEAFASGAVRLDDVSRQPWQHYPEVREAQSDARDEVWQRQERFTELARELEATTAALRELTQAQRPAPRVVAPAFQRVEDSCERCHQEFRVY
ncbi:c-type cytochrome [Stutzerimonas tarimensis]|uniref:C-type cytochrome n=1 Tax=Stutzerimonas tarimensis TaxID=1507735 RepID=A0ABV7T5A9_9GAMM